MCARRGNILNVICKQLVMQNRTVSYFKTSLKADPNFSVDIAKMLIHSKTFPAWLTAALTSGVLRLSTYASPVWPTPLGCMKCRSLGPCSPLAGQLWGLRSNWLPLGMLLCVQWSNEKEAQAESILFCFFFFFFLSLLFSGSASHLYSAICGR